MYSPFPEKYIVPDLETKSQKYNKALKILFPFTLLILPAIPWMILSVKASRYGQLYRIVQVVKQQEKVLLISLLGYTPNAASVARKLIETGNLAGYRLVADIMLVKEGIEVSEEEARAEQAKLFNAFAAAQMGVRLQTNTAAAPLPESAVAPEHTEGPAPAEAAPTPATTKTPAKTTAPKFCPQCGTALSADSPSRFCPQCGAKLS